LALRRARSRLTLKEVRILSSEDAHKVSRKLVAAYKTGTYEPLRELERISPRRKRTEENSLLVLLDEWKNHYNAIRCALEKLPSSKGMPSKRAPPK
jgi:hypothetical protein